MMAQVARTLRPGGVYAQNVIDYPPDRFIKSELATVAAVFPHVALIAPPKALSGSTGSNFVIVASKSPLPLTAIRTGLDRHAADPVTLVPDGSFAGNARVLTDDYAPVDQLLGY
jgi:spermidine synthase